MSFAGFLRHYVTEASAVASALASVVSGIALPFDEKGKVQDTIDLLTQAAANIANALEAGGNLDVKISRSDIEKAVAKVLPDLIETYVKSHMETVILPDMGEPIRKAVADVFATDETKELIGSAVADEYNRRTPDGA